MNVGQFLAWADAVGNQHPERAAEIAAAVSEVFSHAERRARARLEAIAVETSTPSLTAALSDDQKARLLPSLTAEDLGMDDFDEEVHDKVAPVLIGAALGMLGLLGISELSERAQSRLDQEIERLTQIGESARQQVADRLTNAREKGLTVGEAQTVVDGLGQMATSTAADVGQGASQSLAGGITEGTALDEGLAPIKTWLTADDDRVRETHADAEFQSIDAGEPFDVGGDALQYPRDPEGSIEQTANCRCFLGWSATIEDAEAGNFVALTMGDEGAIADQSDPAAQNVIDRNTAEDAAHAAVPVAEQASRDEALLTPVVEALAHENGLTTEGLEFAQKGEKGVADKIARDILEKGLTSDEAAAGIFDAVRYTMMDGADSLVGNAQDVVDRLHAEGFSTNIKNSFAREAGSTTYRGVNVAVTSPTGQQFELQFHTPESFFAKQVETHSLFEEQRDLIAAGRTDTDRYREVVRLQIEIADRVPIPLGAYEWGVAGEGL